MTAKSWLVLVFLAFAFIGGVAGQYYYPGRELPPSDLWLLPVSVFLVFAWYRKDTEQRGYRRSVWLNLFIIGIAILALPYYFVRSRGFKGGALATVVMLIVFLVGAILTVAGQYAVYYGLQVGES